MLQWDPNTELVPYRNGKSMFGYLIVQISNDFARFLKKNQTILSSFGMVGPFDCWASTSPDFVCPVFGSSLYFCV